MLELVGEGDELVAAEGLEGRAAELRGRCMDEHRSRGADGATVIRLPLRKGSPNHASSTSCATHRVKWATRT